MYVRIRQITSNATDNDCIIVISKTAQIGELKSCIFKKINVDVAKQKLYYKGKLLVDDHTIMDYSIGLNDVIQLMAKSELEETTSSASSSDQETSNEPPSSSKPADIKENGTVTNGVKAVEAESLYYKPGDPIDVIDNASGGAWFEAKIVKITKNPNAGEDTGTESDLVFEVQMDRNEATAPFKVVFDEIRPRSWYTYPMSDLKPGMVVLANYNIEDNTKRGYWYNFRVKDVTRTKLKGDVLLGRERTVINDCDIHFTKEVMKIEQPCHISDRTDEFDRKIALRKLPFYCDKCKDVPTKNCKECGCFVCSLKTNPSTLLMCDECDRGFHLACLKPPLTEVPPDSEWYCNDCKTDDTEIVKAGENLKPSNKKQKMASTKNKNSGKSRDWGQGMACVGRTSVCTIVRPEHYGPVPGIEVGTCWKFRIQVSEAGIHRPHVAGIHGRESDGAYSIVLSGGYEDDIDNGKEFYYTGSGGRDLSGNKRVNEQSSDQLLTRMNKALAMNCNVPFNNKTGGEAKDWRGGKPVRVVRNYKGRKHSKYAPEDGNRYDGIYKVVKYYPEKGKSGFIVWRYLLRRDDPTPAPWEKGGQEFPIILPPGYLEAQEAKNEESKNGGSTSKRVKQPKRKSASLPQLFESMKKSSKVAKVEDYKLSKEIKELIDKDAPNKKLWDQCEELLSEGKLKFLNKVEEIFLCVCCQDVVFKPVTTECGHNVCKSCLKRSFSADIYTCPCCRFELDKKLNLKINETLQEILRDLFPGYENGR